MADNIYLLETRLSKAQQAALAAVRDVARTRGVTVFLVGGAVRDLIGGTAVRDLDVVVQGNALKMRKDLEMTGAVVAGSNEAMQALFLRFPGGVRVEFGSAVTVSYPKPGRAVVKPATILDDLRRRDFTANAMALSLNEGSYGLLMDPLNGVADIENRELRLVSNYGFIEDPARMIRAARFAARLGWHMDEKTQARYDTGKAEGYISALDAFHRGYETEEIFHEEDALRVIRRLEEEGWIEHLAPALASARVNVAELERLRESQAQLQMQGVVADASAASFPLLTAKMSASEASTLKGSFPRQGFVEEIQALEARGKEFAGQLGGKSAALPSQSYKLIVASDPEAVLWSAYTTKSPALQAKFRSFYTEWPQARQRIPYLQMQEMRIVPELPEYQELTESLFYELMDGKLQTVEEIKAFLEPYSPPAPPPPVSLRRPRAPKKDAKGKSRKKAAAMDGADEAVEAAELEETANGTTPDGTSDLAGANSGAPEVAVGESSTEAPERVETGAAQGSEAKPEVQPKRKGRSGPAEGDAEAATPKEPRPAVPVTATSMPPAKGSEATKAAPGKKVTAPAKVPAKKAPAPGKKVAGAGNKSAPAKRPEAAKSASGAKGASPAKGASAGKGSAAAKKAAPARKAPPAKKPGKGAPAVKKGAPAKSAGKPAAGKAPANRSAAKKPAPAKKGAAGKSRR